ncbi:MAG: hypothetical protein ABIG42_09065 [bacterium]
MARKKKDESNLSKHLTPNDRKALRQRELDDSLRAERRKRLLYIAGAIVVVLVLCGAAYFVFVKPYDDAKKLIKQAEIYTDQRDFTQALKTLAQAKIIAPKMKGMRYRGGLVQLLQGDYAGAEQLFNEEINMDGHIAGAELALGFIYTIDSVIQDTEIPLLSKKAIAEALSSALQIDITLNKDLKNLALAESGTYSSSITHFARARDASTEFAPAANVGLAFAHALDGNRDGGSKSYSAIANLNLKILDDYYNGIEPKLGVKPDLVADAGEIEDALQIPVDELPPIPDDLEIKPLPENQKTGGNKTYPWQHIKSFTNDPTVKPLKISEYLSKDGETKMTVTLLNITASGKTVAREGQTRKMPKTDVEVTVLKISQDEIIIRENNMHTFIWHKDRNTWFVVKDKEK